MIPQAMVCSHLFSPTTAMSQEEEHVEDQLPWISEIALKKFDYADRAFDTINARAGVVIGWAGLLTAIFFPALGRLPVPARSLVLVFWSIPFAGMIQQGYRAYTVARLKALPISYNSLQDLTSSSSIDARASIIAKIVVSSEINEQACLEKAKHLANAINLFVVQLFILAVSLVILSIHAP